jgi:hypothetical protein
MSDIAAVSAPVSDLLWLNLQVGHGASAPVYKHKVSTQTALSVCEQLTTPLANGMPAPVVYFTDADKVFHGFVSVDIRRFSVSAPVFPVPPEPDAKSNILPFKAKPRDASKRKSEGPAPPTAS